MGIRQTTFLTSFKEAFALQIGGSDWTGGQCVGNVASFTNPALHLRREGKTKRGEAFELGDLRTEYASCTIAVEYDKQAPSIQNLLKYWPYLLGQLRQSDSPDSLVPVRPLVLCHFSNWRSWGAYRDLWDWLLCQIKGDPRPGVRFEAAHFDLGGKDSKDMAGYGQAIQEAISWIKLTIPRIKGSPGSD
jgi:hypothetical protein